jgi:hypothetical protein
VTDPRPDHTSTSCARRDCPAHVNTKSRVGRVCDTHAGEAHQRIAGAGQAYNTENCTSATRLLGNLCVANLTHLLVPTHQSRLRIHSEGYGTTVNTTNRMIASTDMTSRQTYLDSHPSLNASMDDFEAPREFSPTVPDYPSHHSGFRSNANSDYSEASSRRSYSPPAWRKAGSGWFKHHNLSPSRGGYRSKEPSPQYHDALEEDDEQDVTAYRIATSVPLPRSPTKGRSVSNTPEPESRQGADVDRGGGLSPVNENRPAEEPESPGAETPTQSNCKSHHIPLYRYASQYGIL